MAFNNGKQRYELEKEWVKLRCEYRNVGMTENEIKELYKFDLEQYKSNRKYHRYNTSETEMGISLHKIKKVSDEEVRKSVLYTLKKYSWVGVY